MCAEAARLTRGRAAAFFRDHFELGPRRRRRGLRHRLLRARDRRLARPRRRAMRCRSTASRPTSSRCTERRRHRRARPDRLRRASACPIITRAEIEDGALAGRGLEIAWAADPIDLFFLQIQGSGRLRCPTASVMRIGYAGQNGREYVAIGRLMRERGLLAAGRREHAGDRRLAARPSRRGPGDHAREQELHLLPRADRAGAARRARRAGYAARHGRRRSQIRAARARRCSSSSTAPRRTACGSRRIPAARSRAPTASTPSGARATRRRRIAGGMSARARRCPAAQGQRRRVRTLGPDEAELWARVAATIRPLSREPSKPAPPAETGAARRSARPRQSTAAQRRRRRLRAAPVPGNDARRRLGPAARGRARSSPTGRSTFTAITSTRAYDPIDRALERAIARRRAARAAGHRPSAGRANRRSSAGGSARRSHDWLAASRHAAAIAAVRGAHRRHGGGGSLYIILRRRRRCTFY